MAIFVRFANRGLNQRAGNPNGPMNAMTQITASRLFMNALIVRMPSLVTTTDDESAAMCPTDVRDLGLTIPKSSWQAVPHSRQKLAAAKWGLPQ